MLTAAEGKAVPGPSSWREKSRGSVGTHQKPSCGGEVAGASGRGLEGSLTGSIPVGRPTLGPASAGPSHPEPDPQSHVHRMAPELDSVAAQGEVHGELEERAEEAEVDELPTAPQAQEDHHAALDLDGTATRA